MAGGIRGGDYIPAFDLCYIGLYYIGLCDVEKNFFLRYYNTMENEKELKELMVVDGLMEAEIIKSRLESFEIPCMLKFESAGRLMGITMDGLGEVKVMVSPGDYDKAREIMSSGEPTEGEPTEHTEDTE